MIRRGSQRAIPRSCTIGKKMSGWGVMKLFGVLGMLGAGMILGCRGDAITNVPPDSAASPSVSLLTGVWVFSGHADPRPEIILDAAGNEIRAVPGTQAPARHPWKALRTNDRNMALGQYDERDPAITAKRLEWMEQAGINLANYQVDWAHEQAIGKMPPWRPRLDNSLLMSHSADHHAQYHPNSPVRFSISNWDVMASAGDKDAYWAELKSYGWTIADARESWRLYAHTVATRYMGAPNYLTVDNRPVLFQGYAHTLPFYEAEFGLKPAQIVAIIRDEIRAVTGKNVYLVATATEESTWPNLKAWGFDALTHYALTSGSWAGAVGAYRHWWERGLAFARTSGLKYWIPVSVGYDATAIGSPIPDRCEPTPAEFIAHLKEARKLAADNFTLTDGMIWIYAWNEIGEGGILEPMMPGQLHDGDEMLRALRQVIKN